MAKSMIPTTPKAAPLLVPKPEDFQVHTLKRKADDSNGEITVNGDGQSLRKKPTTSSIKSALTAPTARTSTATASVRTSSRTSTMTSSLTVPKSKASVTTRVKPSATVSNPKTNTAAALKTKGNSVSAVSTNPSLKKKRPDWDTKGRLADLEEQYRSTKHMLTDSTCQVSSMKSKLSENQAMINELLHFRATLEETVQAKEKQVSHVEIELSSIQSEKKILTEQFEEKIQKINKEHESKVTELCKELLELKVARDGMSDELSLSKSEITQLKMAVSAQATASIALESTNRALKTSLEESERVVSERNSTVVSLETDCKQLRETVEELHAKLRDEETARRKLHNTIQELKGNIRVFCRVRPTLGAEASETTTNITPHITFSDSDEGAIGLVQFQENAQGNKTVLKTYPFDFDKVFRPSAQQSEIFEEISQLIQSALDGYNVCIFAYGQTGSGKTFTGPEDPNIGMIPRAVEQIFQSAENLVAKGWQYTMEAQFIEIYNETIRDLLVGTEGSVNSSISGSQNSSKKHEIRHDHSNNRTSVTDVVNVVVTTPKQVFHLLKKAAQNRAIAATNCNERSSRSHSVFTLRLTGSNSLTEETSYGVLNLIDLAGSERLSSSGSTGERLKETQAINKSLSCLGDVVFALSNKEAHIPYRNSKLTYLLQNSLGGNSKTLMFVNMSPTAESIPESLCSLRFATKVNSCQIGTARRQIQTSTK
ncbi:kinesin-like nuclear fusion protein, variant 2 [Batrachochytrium dendrobatidis]|nr:kinesin-like nuclear fusion protein, variant 2 [Batrachochytrium dendrobatidis]